MSRSKGSGPVKLFWVFDAEDSPQGHPLKVLVNRILDELNGGTVSLYFRRSDGYGLKVCEWDRALDAVDEIAIPVEELVLLLSRCEEWFYNLDARCTAGTGIRFGLHDSSALFLEAPEVVCVRILQPFERVSEDRNSRPDSGG